MLRDVNWPEFWGCVGVIVSAIAVGWVACWHTLAVRTFSQAQVLAREIVAKDALEAAGDRKRFDDGYVEGYRDGLTATERAGKPGT